jgi:hypothetical protein
MMSSGHLRSWWVSILQVFFNSIRYNLFKLCHRCERYTFFQQIAAPLRERSVKMRYREKIR